MSVSKAITGKAESASIPVTPDVFSLLRFHRAPDGFVSLHRKPTADTFVNLGAFLPGELEEIFPELREELERDSYFSVNSFYLPKRKTKNLRYLNSAYVDLDCYGVSASEALGKVVQAMAECVIPSASIFGLSGRGIWLFYLLRDVKEPGPQRAFPEKRLLYQRIQKALHGRVTKALPELGADGNALDSARVTRVAGSLNSKSGNRVAHYASLTPEGRLRFYTLPELAELLDVEEKKAAKIVRFGKRVPNRLNGWAASWEKRLRYFETLRGLRGGGFAEGHRNLAAYFYATLLRRNGLREGDVFLQVAELGKRCKPPLSQVEVLGAVVSTQATNPTVHLSTARMSAVLRPTPSELLALAPFEPKKRPPRPPSQKRKARIETRRARALEVIGELGEVPTCADMARILSQEGFPASPATVTRDYEAVGVAVPRKRRPRGRVRQPRLPAL